jgi:hypothetical protein
VAEWNCLSAGVEGRVRGRWPINQRHFRGAVPEIRVFGRITPEHASHADYRRHLARVIENGFARFAL